MSRKLSDARVNAALGALRNGCTREAAVEKRTEEYDEALGLYHADIPVVSAGLHYFRWEGTGAVTAAEESTFNVVTAFS